MMIFFHVRLVRQGKFNGVFAIGGFVRLAVAITNSIRRRNFLNQTFTRTLGKRRQRRLTGNPKVQRTLRRKRINMMRICRII